ncbi:MAG: hypothetical protein II938_03620 [Alphaproteobacteria bacterium]|nr:hypothetical protein [Alphaproteobacteria bacterium]
MKKKQTLSQRIKNWWTNLPHKWFVLFQIIPALLYAILLPSSILVINFNPDINPMTSIIGAPILFTFICLICLSPLLLLSQLVIIAKLYGAKALLINLACLATTLLIVFIALCAAVGMVWGSIRHFEEVLGIATCIIGAPLFYVILSILLAQRTKHGRK